MRFASRLAVLTIAAAALGGCYTFSSPYVDGRDFDRALVGQITKGKTTSARASELLGPPARVYDFEGGQKWVYVWEEGDNLAQYEWRRVVRVYRVTTRKSLTLEIRGGVVVDAQYAEGSRGRGVVADVGLGASSGPVFALAAQAGACQAVRDATITRYSDRLLAAR